MTKDPVSKFSVVAECRRILDTVDPFLAACLAYDPPLSGVSVMLSGSRITVAAVNEEGLQAKKVVALDAVPLSRCLSVKCGIESTILSHPGFTAKGQKAKRSLSLPDLMRATEGKRGPLSVQ